MAMVSLLAASLLIVQTDTVRLTSAEFLDQALAAAPGVEPAELQADAARARADQTRAWANPQLSLQVDNYGAEREVTNIDGLAGLEAQAVFAFPLSVGGDRGHCHVNTPDSAGAADGLPIGGALERSLDGEAPSLVREVRSARSGSPRLIRGRFRTGQRAGVSAGHAQSPWGHRNCDTIPKACARGRLGRLRPW